MIDWENIIGDKLRAYEKDLPEGCLDGLKTCLEAQESPSGKRQVTPWVWIAVPALAAVAAVAAIFIPGNNGADVIDIIPEPTYVAQAGTEQAPDILIEDSVERVDGARSGQVGAVNPETEADPDPVPVRQPEHREEEKAPDLQNQDDPSEGVDVEEGTDQSPFVPQNEDVGRKVDVRLGTTIVGTVAGGASIALVSMLVGEKGIGYTSSVSHDSFLEYAYSSGGNYNINDPVNGMDLVHKMPVKIGASLRIPLYEKLSLTTGLEYSMYSSSFKDSSVEAIRQKVRYLGIPVRLDYQFVNGRWIGVYVGAGASANLCTGAWLEEKSARRAIPKDGLSFSLLGAAGVQFNITDHFGFFIEPEISWTAGSRDNVLQTYRTAHPIVFNVSSGFRFTL